jgi:hypothetical protein
MRFCLPTALLFISLALTPTRPWGLPLRTELETPVLDMSLDVQALRTLYLLRMTADQVKKLQSLAKEIATPDHDRDKPRVSEDYRRVLSSLCDALAADDEDKVEELEDRLSELTDSESPELDDAVPVTVVARRRAPEVLRLLRPRQLASYLGSIAEEVGDPHERLVAALAEVRSEKNPDWEETRDEIAEDLGWLLGGLDLARAKAIREQVAAFLDRAHHMTDEAFGKQRAALEREARAFGAGVSSFDILRHAVERSLARLLSNPRLVPALEARLRLAGKRDVNAEGGGR